MIGWYLRLKSSALRHTYFSFRQTYIPAPKQLKGTVRYSFMELDTFLCHAGQIKATQRHSISWKTLVLNGQRPTGEIRKMQVIETFQRRRGWRVTGDAAMMEWKEQPQRLLHTKVEEKVYHFVLLGWWRKNPWGQIVRQFLILLYQGTLISSSPLYQASENLRKSLHVRGKKDS